MANYNLAEFKEYTLFPTLFEKLDSVFPEMNFKRVGNKWESIYHLDGERDSIGKVSTYVYSNSKFCIIDHATGESKGLIDFYIERRNIRDFWEGIENLCKECNLTPFSGDREEYREYKPQQDKREAAFKAFTSALWEDTAEAKEVLEYLHARKWTDAEIKEKGIGLVTTKILNTLEERSEFSSAIRDKDGKVIGSIGSTHTLAIPYWNGSRLFGFKVREPREALKTNIKYLNTFGLTKSKGLFGIGIGIEDVVIVEGELDALHAQAKGYENIAATTGGAATEEQLQEAIKRGAKKFTLLFDNDKAGRNFILKVSEDGRETGTLPIAEKLGIDTYIAYLPDGIKDVDEFFQQGRTSEELNTIVESAIPSYMYRYERLVEKYQKKEKEKGEVTPKERENFLAELGEIINAPYMKPYNREVLFKAIEKAEDSLLVGMDGYREYLNTAYKLRLQKERKEATEKASAEIKSLVEKGETEEALRIMKHTADKAGATDKATEYSRLFAPLSPNEYSALLSEIREGLPTGYAFTQGNREEALTLNVGLTFVCGYRGHGKTTFLNNIALNEAYRQLNIKSNGGEAKSVLYFSYEIDKRRLIANLLNTFVNDKDLSKKPTATIYDYFRNTTSTSEERKAQHFTGQRSGDHYKNFVNKKNDFFKNYLSSGVLTIVDEPYKVEQLLEAIKFYTSIRPISLVCIDYAQLIYSEAAKNKARYEEIKKIVNEMKDFANKESIPFVLAAQFNRDVESPVSVDTKSIGEGGDFERIADTCIGLYNLKELHTPSENSEKSELIKLLEKIDIKKHLPDNFDVKNITPVEGKIFVRLMKRRYGDSPLDTILNWQPLTGRIEQNDKAHYLIASTETELFVEEDIDLPF